MNYSMEQIKIGLAAYLDSEFMPLLDESPLKKVMIGTAISLGINKYSAMAELLKENQFVKALDIFDAEGNVDATTLMAAVKANVPNEGVPINIPTVGTITLKADDADKLMSYISRTAK